MAQTPEVVPTRRLELDSNGRFTDPLAAHIQPDPDFEYFIHNTPPGPQQPDERVPYRNKMEDREYRDYLRFKNRDNYNNSRELNPRSYEQQAPDRRLQELEYTSQEQEDAIAGISNECMKAWNANEHLQMEIQKLENVIRELQVQNAQYQQHMRSQALGGPR